jgi:hypothetical protein
MVTVASQGRVARNPIPPRTARSELMKRLCDSHIPPVNAARSADNPKRRLEMVLEDPCIFACHHWHRAKTAAMAAKYQMTAGD